MSHLTEIKRGAGVADRPSIRGAPAQHGRFGNPDLELLGWTPPTFLRALYGIHHGYGPHAGRWLPFAFLPWSQVVPLTTRVRFGEENICWDPADCILFCRDETGGGWVFEGRDDPRWCRFDGVTHALEPVDPWAAVARIVEHW